MTMVKTQFLLKSLLKIFVANYKPITVYVFVGKYLRILQIIAWQYESQFGNAML